MIAIAIYVAPLLAVLAAAGTLWALLPSRVLWHVGHRKHAPKLPHQYNMTVKAHRVRYTSTESDIRDWDLVHVRDTHMVVHHVTLIMGMTVMVAVILMTGETAGAIATGALASQDGIELLRDLMARS